MSLTTIDFTLRQASDTDRDAIYAILQSAFPTPAEAELVKRLDAQGYVRLMLLAEVLDKPVGVIIYSELKAPFKAVSLAPIAILPAQQNSGIGSALIGTSIAEISKQGWEAIFVLGEPNYYERFGFSAEAARGFTCVYACEAFMMLRLSPASTATGEIIYPPPFAEL